MTGHNPAVPPATISDTGDRIVIETNYLPGRDRCQLIFVRTRLGDGATGWEMSLCWPGVPTVLLTDEQARQLAFGLRSGGSTSS